MTPYHAQLEWAQARALLAEDWRDSGLKTAHPVS
jgi:hypothetical protein